MALPSSGQLSMSDINIELENPSTATITLNDDRVRTLLQRPNSASEIGMNAAYGKTDFSGFVSLSSETQAIYSSDGITWNTSTLPGSTNRLWPCVTFGNGKFVAAQGGTTGNETSTQGAWSLSGQTWNSMTLPAAKNWRTIAYGNGLFVLWSPGDTDNLATSADGINWTLEMSSTGSSNQLVITCAVTLNTWQHIAWVKTAGNIICYKNGVSDSGGSYTINTVASRPYMGIVYGTNLYSYYNGRIGNFLIYNRALSASEVSQNYNATKGRFGL